MNIGEAEYIAATDDILATGERHGHDEASGNGILAILYALEDEIMGV